MKNILFGGVAYSDGDILAVLPADFQRVRASDGRLLRTPLLFYVTYDEENDAMAISAISWEVAEAISKDRMTVALDRVGWSMSIHSTAKDWTK